MSHQSLHDSLQKRMPYAFCLVLILMTAFMLYGCSTIKIANIPAQPIGQYKYTTVTDRFSIAIHPFFTEEESEKYFGAYLFAKRILPVLLVVENRSYSSSFIIEKEQCILGETSAMNNTQNLSTASLPGLVVSKVGSATGSPIFLLVGMNMYSKAEMIRHNFLKIELQRQTISPGQEVRGVIYFNIPDAYITNPPQGLVLYIKMQEIGTNSFETVYISFEWKGESE